MKGNLIKQIDFKDSYSDDDVKAVNDILRWLNDNGQTKTWLYKLSRVNTSTGSLLLSGKYPTTPSTHLKQMTDAISNQFEQRSISNAPWVNTTTSKMITAACNRARKYGNFSIITGHVGTGKTASLKRYAASRSNTFLVECNPNMSPNTLIDKLVKQTNTALLGTYNNRDAKFSALVDTLRDTDTLIIIDEAETAAHNTLHYIRRLSDQSRIGIVLAGTEKMYNLIAPEGGEFDQIRSRVGFWPPVIRSITQKDAAAVASAFLEDNPDLNEEVHDRLWYWCKGSMRMLVENLLPTLRDYGLSKHKLSPDLVDEIAKKALNLKGDK